MPLGATAADATLSTVSIHVCTCVCPSIPDCAWGEEEGWVYGTRGNNPLGAYA